MSFEASKRYSCLSILNAEFAKSLIVLSSVLAVLVGCNSGSEVQSSSFSKQGQGASLDEALGDVRQAGDGVVVSARLPFEIDGVFDEWDRSHLIASDPVGDASGGFDLVSLMAAALGDRLYLSVTLNESDGRTLQNGREEDGTLQLLLGDGTRKLLVDLRARTFLSEGETLAWRDFNFGCLPTYAANRYELGLDLPGWELENLTVNVGGSDQLEQPARITSIAKESASMAILDLAKEEATFRIANLNTLDNGLVDPQRKPSQQRMLAAVEAEVYTFQEEWNESKFDTAVPELEKVLGSKLRKLWFGGCAILSRLPMEPIPMALDRAVAGLVEVNPMEHVAVISVHLKSGGYAGSREDSLRIQQAEQLTGEIQRMRRGEFGTKAQNAAIVIVGDYNMVGSKMPLDVLRSAGLKDVLFKDQITGDAMTWQGETRTTFWPGRLDWLCHGEKLSCSKGVVFNSRTLDSKVLGALNLEASDSQASDHLMLIGDFRFRN